MLHHPTIEDLVLKISQFPGVERVILFGSRATGKNQTFSDIDLAVLGVHNDEEWTHIHQVAETTRTLLKIDLLRFERVERIVQDSIMKEGKILYERSAR